MHISSTLAVPDTADTPHHVAIIMDGNGRWATERHLPRMAGTVVASMPCVPRSRPQTTVACAT